MPRSLTCSDSCWGYSQKATRCPYRPSNQLLAANDKASVESDIAYSSLIALLRGGRQWTASSKAVAVHFGSSYQEQASLGYDLSKQHPNGYQGRDDYRRCSSTSIPLVQVRRALQVASIIWRHVFILRIGLRNGRKTRHAVHMLGLPRRDE